MCTERSSRLPCCACACMPVGTPPPPIAYASKASDRHNSFAPEPRGAPEALSLRRLVPFRALDHAWGVHEFMDAQESSQDLWIFFHFSDLTMESMRCALCRTPAPPTLTQPFEVSGFPETLNFPHFSTGDLED